MEETLSPVDQDNLVEQLKEIFEDDENVLKFIEQTEKEGKIQKLLAFLMVLTTKPHPD